MAQQRTDETGQEGNAERHREIETTGKDDEDSERTGEGNEEHGYTFSHHALYRGVFNAGGHPLRQQILAHSCGDNGGKDHNGKYTGPWKGIGKSG